MATETDDDPEDVCGLCGVRGCDCDMSVYRGDEPDDEEDDDDDEDSGERSEWWENDDDEYDEN